MKAITLFQPWATLLVLGEKRIETRSWKPSDKMLESISGQPVAIHAARVFPKEAKSFARLNKFAADALRRHGFDNPDLLPLGAIIGTIEIAGLVRSEILKTQKELSEKELALGDYSDGRWCWKIKKPRWFTNPVGCKGTLSLWQVAADIEEEILVRLNR